MMIRTLAAAAVLALSAPASADALLDRLVADAKAVGPDDFAWTRTLRSEQRGGDEVKVRNVIDRYDPSRPVGQRWTLVSIDGRAPTADEADDYRKGTAQAIVPNYGRLARYLGSGAQRATEGSRTVYRAATLPKGSLQLNKNDLSAGARAEVLVAEGTKPYIERLDVMSTKPVRMMLVVKVDRLDATTRYKLMPDGRAVVAEQVSEMRGSMMGKAGTIRTVASFSDHRAVTRTPAQN